MRLRGGQCFSSQKIPSTAHNCKDQSGQTYMKNILTLLDRLICGEPGSTQYKVLYAKDIQLCRNDWLRKSRHRRSKIESTIQLPIPELPKCIKEPEEAQEQQPAGLLIYLKLIIIRKYNLSRSVKRATTSCCRIEQLPRPPPGRSLLLPIVRQEPSQANILAEPAKA